MKRSPLSSRGLIALAFALLPGSALAVDGVLEINQASVLAGGITPGDAPGFPATLSLPGSYRLTGNLDAPAGAPAGIQLAADHISVDLNGFGIFGGQRCQRNAQNGVVCSGDGPQVGIEPTVRPGGAGRFEYSTVRNGTIRGVGVAVFATGGEVSGLTILDVVTGVIGGNSTIKDTLVERCQTGLLVSAATVDHVQFFAVGSVAIDGRNLTVLDVTAAGGADRAFRISRSRIDGCAVRDFAGPAIDARTRPAPFPISPFDTTLVGGCVIEGAAYVGGAVEVLSGSIVQAGVNLCNGAPCP